MARGRKEENRWLVGSRKRELVSWFSVREPKEERGREPKEEEVEKEEEASL